MLQEKDSFLLYAALREAYSKKLSLTCLGNAVNAYSESATVLDPGLKAENFAQKLRGL